MSLLQTIKSAQLQARRDRRTDVAASLTTLIGEAEAVGKNAGNRAPTDAEVTAMLKKFIKNANEVVNLAKVTNEVAAQRAQEEVALYEGFLPPQLTEQQLRTAIDGFVVDYCISYGQQAPKIGDVIKFLKANYDGQYDGVLASTIIKQVLA